MTPSGMNDMGSPDPEDDQAQLDQPGLGAPEPGGGMAPSCGPTMDCVPLDALASPDESEQMVPPAVGDKVSYQTEGTVAQIVGDNVYVKKTAVNGDPVEPDADDQVDQGDQGGGSSDEQEMQGLQEMAKQQDAAGGQY